MTTVVERQCPLCGKPAHVAVDEERWQAYQEGLRLGMPAATHGIQVIFHDLSAADREILISGCHDACFDSAFSDEDEE